MRVETKLFLIMICATLSAMTAAAQSTNPSSPTPVTGQYKGKGPGSETNYYFKFTGGPGAISVRLDVKAKEYSTFARIEIGNDPSNLIAMHNMNASTATGPSNVVKQFKLSSQQSVRIKLTLDGNLAEYTLAVSGAGVGIGGSSENAGGGSGSSKSGKPGKLTTGSGAKLTGVGSQGIKPIIGKQGTGSNKEKELRYECPTEIYYQIVPVADWDALFFAKKRFVFVDGGATGSMLSCNYSASTGVGTDSSTLIRYAPAGYTCYLYNSGPHSRLFTCTVGVTSEVMKPGVVEKSSGR